MSVPEYNPDRYLENSVQDLLSLKARTVVITGAARGLGLAFTLAVVEVGGNVAVLDAAEKPHEHFYKIQKQFPNSKLEFYRCAGHMLPIHNWNRLTRVMMIAPT